MNPRDLSDRLRYSSKMWVFAGVGFSALAISSGVKIVNAWSPTTVTGIATVTDGDTLRIGNTKLRISGIDAPEMDTQAGRDARDALKGLLGSWSVRCDLDGTRSHDRMVATCFTNGGRDIAEWMVSHDHAFDCPRFSHGKYAGLGTGSLERTARRGRFCEVR